jgi:exodeoxyribonuclease VII large subunit
MFDAYPLARAVARFPIPVITGLGHQKDVSVCDLMAHTALKTPTKAAEFILAHNRNFEENILQFQHQILIRSQQILIREKERIARTNQQIQRSTGLMLSKHSELLNTTRQKVISQSTGLVYVHARNLNLLSRQMSTRPALIVGKAQHELSSYIKELQAGLTRFTQKQENYLGHYTTVFKLLSPPTTLKRGFALVLDQGRILTDASSIKKGDSVQVYLNGSELDVTITKKQKNNGDQFDL